MTTFLIVSLGALAVLAYVDAYRAHRIVSAPGGRGFRPAAATEPPTPSASRPRESVEFKGKALRVLVVDDTPAQRLLTVELLRDMGHTSDEAVNGAEALKAIKNADYDMVLMDYEMPVMDGITATRAIKTLRNRRTLPVIMISGRSEASVRSAATDAGVSHYVEKPLRVSSLKSVLSRYAAIAPTALHA